MISALMATGDAAPTLMRDTLYSIIMIVTGGLVGFSLLLGGRKFATQYMNLFGIKQYLIALFPLAIIVLVFPIGAAGRELQHRAIAAGGGNFGGHVRRFPAYSDQNPSKPVCFMSMKTTATMTTRTTVNRPPTAAGGIPPGCWCTWWQ